MNKYVDIDEVMDEAPLWMENDKNDKIVDRFFNAGWNTSLGMFIHDINKLSTINIVKCKDCKYAEYNSEDEGYECRSSGAPYVYEADWFCADGRPKGENDG